MQQQLEQLRHHQEHISLPLTPRLVASVLGYNRVEGDGYKCDGSHLHCFFTFNETVADWTTICKA